MRFSALIGAAGAVKEARPVSAHRLPLPAALKAVRNYRCRPTFVDGEPVEVLTWVVVRSPAGEWTGLPPGTNVNSPADPHRVGGNVTAPKLIRKVELQYTEEARDAGLMGTAVLGFEIRPDGNIQNVAVKKGLGLDDEAIGAIGQWEFLPATKYGKPVRVGATIEIHFRLY